MDNINPIGQGDLAKYMGLTKDKDGNDDATGNAVSDASNSKMMRTIANSQNIEYFYRRGGVTLRATINVPEQKITWEVSGINNQTNRKTALREGLKLATDGDLAEVANELWT